jgi:hypothetical protein
VDRRFFGRNSLVAIFQFPFWRAADRFRTDFEKFHVEQVRGFKQHLYEQTGVRSKAPLSHATIYSTLNTLKAFFMWLAGQGDYCQGSA